MTAAASSLRTSSLNFMSGLPATLFYEEIGPLFFEQKETLKLVYLSETENAKYIDAFVSSEHYHTTVKDKSETPGRLQGVTIKCP